MNKLSVAQRNFGRSTQTKFAKTFDRLGRKLEKVFAKAKHKKLESFAQLLSILQVHKGAFWAIAASFYKHGANRKPGIKKLKKFIEECPPFHAFVLSLVMAEYGYSIRDHKAHGSYRAERSDLLSALISAVLRHFRDR